MQFLTNFDAWMTYLEDILLYVRYQYYGEEMVRGTEAFWHVPITITPERESLDGDNLYYDIFQEFFPLLFYEDSK